MATDRTGHVDRVTAAVVIATAAATGFLLVMGFADPARLLPGAASPAARTLTYYQGTRTTVLVGAAVWLLARGHARPLRLVLILNAITQSGDAVIGLAARHSAPAQWDRPALPPHWPTPPGASAARPHLARERQASGPTPGAGRCSWAPRRSGEPAPGEDPRRSSGPALSLNRQMSPRRQKSVIFLWP